MNRPEVWYPTLIRGIVDGPIRLEAIDGSEYWLSPRTGIFTFPPTVIDNKTYCLTHLQKKAKYFSLLYSPFIYHHWVGQPQQQNPDGSWIEGSEKGNLWLGGYWRSPGWRWQRPDANSNWTPWIFSGGRIPGTHFD